MMRAQGHGRIVQCSSILGLVPYRWRGAYTASKYALEGLSITLRMELEGSGVHVSLIEPGPIRSRFTANALAYVEKNIDLEALSIVRNTNVRWHGSKATVPGSRASSDPKPSLAVLRHALTAARPRPHYLVTRPAKNGALLKRLLPASLFYAILRRLG